MIILFRADSSSQIGTGHIMRDLVLATQYIDAKIIFASMDLKGNLNHKIIEAGYEIEILKTNQPEELIQIIGKHQIDLLVIDHYEIDFEFEKKIKDTTQIQILSFDDTYEKHHCDILLNHNISANQSRYIDLIPENCELRCGNKYTLIRDEFIIEKKNYREKEAGFTTIFVAMGGADSDNVTLNILEELSSFNKIKVNIITTSSNPNIHSLEKFVKDKSWLKLHVNSEQLAKIMNRSQLAIVSPSVILHEVMYMELPYIAIKTANNQSDIYNYLRNKNKAMLEVFCNNKFKSLLQLKLKEMK